jgi:class 3 adenylate cyclase
VSAPAAAAPSVVVTSLFTDVLGSTRRWEADAQAMRAALVVHDKVLRTAIEAYDGFLFSHTGDGVVAAFASPMSAVSAAIDAQRELQFAGVVIAGTIGGAGKLEFTLIGDTVNMAARVEQLTKATGDAILLTQQCVDALGSRPPGLIDRGGMRIGFANDDFTRNLIRWVGEERLVLMVERPAAVLKLVNIP